MVSAHMAGVNALQSADIVIITFGTAWAYYLKECGEVVANCHKQPQSLFSRQLLSVEHIAKRYDKLLSDGALAQKRVIFTVSPIRHLADGAEDNSLSKATLRVAIAELVRNHSNVEYFTSQRGSLCRAGAGEYCGWLLRLYTRPYTLHCRGGGGV